MSKLSVIERDGFLVVDSRLIGQDLEVQHKHLLETLDKYLNKIEASFGVVRFETEKPLKGSKGGRPERVAYLTEEQATLLMTFSRNTERVVECKVALVQAFSKAKQLIKELTHTTQSQDAELKNLELQLILAKQRYQDTGYAIQLSTSPATLAWLRGETPPPPKVEYKERFIDSRTGKEVGSFSGRSLTQLIADAGLNPKSKSDRNRVKKILKCYGLDYDSGQDWSTASYLREYPVLEDSVYDRALKVVLAEVLVEGTPPNLFVHQMQQVSLPTLSKATKLLEDS